MVKKLLHICNLSKGRPSISFNIYKDVNIENIYIFSIDIKGNIEKIKDNIKLLNDNSNDKLLYTNNFTDSLKIAYQIILDDIDIKCIILNDNIHNNFLKIMKNIKLIPNRNVKIYMISHGILDHHYGSKFKMTDKSSIIDYYIIPRHNEVYYKKKNLILLDSLPQIDWGVKVKNDMHEKYKQHIFTEYIHKQNLSININYKTIFIINDFKRCKINNKVLLEFNTLLEHTINFAQKNNYIILLKIRYKGIDKKSKDMDYFNDLIKNHLVFNLPEYIYTYQLFFSDITVIHNNGTSYIEALAANHKTVLVQLYDFHDNLNSEKYNLIKCKKIKDYIKILNLFNSDKNFDINYQNRVKKYLDYWFGNYRNNSIKTILNSI